MKVMLLIDADNVSTDVMEQAVAALLAEHGALAVRRAYCTAESALKHQAVFKRLGIRPMVNLAAGKNSTDIALAVDALDLAISERPGLVAIASSDSDFAPLVSRLREKGCLVVGIGQQGKTGDETQTVYDGFTVLAHRKSVARKTATAPAAKKAPARKKAVAPAPPPPPPPAAAPPEAPDRLRQILMALPELVRGATVELRVAAERLREAGLLSKSGSSTKIFGGFPEKFELLPAKNPNQVRLKA
jgi:uncharacterized protein (TIGR00288 family)